MNSTRQHHRSSTDWLLESQWAPYFDAVTHHLSEWRAFSAWLG